MFLHNNENKFHPYSNEFHDVIRADFNVSWKPNLDKALFERHLAQKEDKKYPLLETAAEYIDLVVDSVRDTYTQCFEYINNSFKNRLN
ncbi:hypothetical protein BD560DRAFT_168024 [Blakeslea trispora]|nr:hypothetical protein BD560DRAFT_168024 [Blakeslea trispora]